MPLVAVSPGRITTVTLNRPEVRNALNQELVAELSDWVGRLPTDGSVRAVVLQGAGPVFCAGADLAWMARIARFTRDENLEDARRTARLLHRLDSLPVPLVGRVHGAALGGGAGLAAVCDIVVSADDAVFGFTETTLGILPALISPYVVGKIGLSRARALSVSGVRFSAAHALEIGLVHEIVPAGQLDAAVARRLDELGRAAPSAIAATKRLLADVAGRRAADVMALTVDALSEQRASPEGQEGLRAFLGRRPPAWAAGTRATSTGGRKATSRRSRRGRPKTGGRR
jgi:methylglutaconyl-CoA hydratase